MHEAPATTPPAVPARGYDVAVLNSVAQYFPSTRYLEDVLHRIVLVMRPGGHIFLGDLRNGDLLEEFACLKHHRRATPGTRPGGSRGRSPANCAATANCSCHRATCTACPPGSVPSRRWRRHRGAAPPATR
ncbi:hypothetical protein NKH18_42405 [Streptomyces sp. M10(2022)]